MVRTIKLVLIAIAVSLILLLAQRADADDYVSIMAGVFSSAANNPTEVKAINIGHRGPVGLGIIYQYEVGGWVDIAGQGRLSSGYGAFQFGAEAGDETIARVMFGPAIITAPDAYLGGVFQFTADFLLGLRGRNGNEIGVKYKHVSSAGIEQPNMGRDLLGVEVGIPF